MEAAGGGGEARRRQIMVENGAESANLGDLLRIKQDDNNNNNNRRNISSDNGGHSVGLTLGAVLSGEMRSMSMPVQSNRTLLDIIRDEPFGKNGKDEKKSWKLLKHKLKWRAGSGSSWASFVSSVQNNNYDNHNNNNNNRFIPRRNSAGSMSNPGGAELEAPTSLASLMMRSSSAVMLNGNQSQDVDRGQAADFGGGEAEEGQGESQGGGGGGVEQPVRMSLMALLEETDRQIGVDGSTYMVDDNDEEEEDVFMDVVESVEEIDQEEGSGGVRLGEYNNCCVCMVRHKGAAFIPCGHTFCRVCSRELWVQRGNCPLCNNLILEILDIF